MSERNEPVTEPSVAGGTNDGDDAPAPRPRLVRQKGIACACNEQARGTR